MMLHEYDKVEFKSISEDNTDDLSKEDKEKLEENTATNKRLLDALTEALKADVDEVVISTKLVDAPLCISTRDGMSLEMEKTLNEQPGMDEEVKAKKVLELNPNHPLFEAFASIQEDDEMVKEYASILYDEAMLLEGRDIKNKSDFVKKLNELMLKALKK